MSERLNLQDLIDQLAKRQEITKKDAESFLRELFALISETIEENDFVRIKDFGTFKLVKVNARKSVDVNTGEDIEIPAHFKLSFTPDKLLKEAVNRPFAHFESVLLEDGVNFENVDDELEPDEDEDIVKEEDDESIASEVAISDNDEVLEQIHIETESFKHPLVEVDSLDEEAIIEIEKEEIPLNQEDEQQIEGTSIQEAIEIQEPHIESQSLEPENEVEEKSLEAISDKALSETEPQDIPQASRRKKRYLVFFSLLVIAGFVIGGLYFQQMHNLQLQQKEAKENPMLVKVDSIPPLSDSTLVAKEDSVQSELYAPVEDLKNETKENISKLVVADVNKSIATETIKEGQTLRLISFKHYGHKSFWVYIYQENIHLIKNPNNVPLGTRLVIPAPAKYNIDATNKESIEKAKKIESEYFKKLNL